MIQPSSAWLAGREREVDRPDHLFEQECRPKSGAAIYLTEERTPFFQIMARRFPGLTGSEYLGETVPFGARTADGTLNESILQLTFPAASFDFILCLDVFEHLPVVERAFAECARCLKPGGQMLFSVPFLVSSGQNIVRARMNSAGEIEHLLPPEHHGDPLNAAGCLCFSHFGWEMLGVVRASGFARAYGCVFAAPNFGYLGGAQLLFLAQKSL